MEFCRFETGYSDPNVAYMILTIKVLCDLAGLSETEPVEKSAKPAKKAAATKKLDKSQKSKKNADKKNSSSPAEQHENPGIRISINIDLAGGSDPDLRDLVMKLLQRQLEL